MGDCKLSLLSDKEVEEAIYNIDTWLAMHTTSLYNRHITAEDLAVAIPGECLFPELLEENEEAPRELEKGVLVYTDAREEQYLWVRGAWQPLEHVLSITCGHSGWVQTHTLGERLLVLVLTQLDYRAREAQGEVPYGCCPPSDVTHLLWAGGTLAGMASLKPRGSSIWGGPEAYACDTLDTLFVRAAHRRQGHALALLAALAKATPPGCHLALSHPISVGMCKVLLKFVRVYPALRETLWTLDEDGEVAGTVLLMLGSMMVRGGLLPPASIAPQQSTLATAIDHQRSPCLKAATACVATTYTLSPTTVPTTYIATTAATTPLCTTPSTDSPAAAMETNTTAKQDKQVSDEEVAAGEEVDALSDKDEPCDTS